MYLILIDDLELQVEAELDAGVWLDGLVFQTWD